MFPIHLNLGFRIFYFYEGLYFFVSILTATAVGIAWIKKNKAYTDYFSNILFVGILFAVIGTRVSHFLFWNLDLFLKDPLVIFRVWEGGASIVGGLIGAFLSVFIYCRIRKNDFFKYAALSSPAILLGQAIGRIGCFLNGDAAGTVSDLPWAIRFPRYGHLVPGLELDTAHSSYPWFWSYKNGLVAQDSLWSAPLHPTQLYEAGLDLALMAIILVAWFRYVKDSSRYSVIFLLHIGGYSLIRFFMEFIRQDREQVLFWNMSFLQVFLLVGALVSAFLIAVNAVRKPLAG
jgi:phosphatidylglycerol---prolipoprotein diacylglyceryl transferase